MQKEINKNMSREVNKVTSRKCIFTIFSIDRDFLYTSCIFSIDRESSSDPSTIQNNKCCSC